MRPCPSLGLLRAAPLVLITMLLAAPAPAHGQGTEGMFAGPMTTKEITGYGTQLNLSKQQLMAVERIHDAYLREYRTLREGPIQDLMDTIREYSSRQLPERDEFVGVMRTLDVLWARTRDVDERFFDRVLPILSESQTDRLPRVRMARERARAAGMRMGWLGRPPVDLSVVAAQIPMSDSERQAVDPLLYTYEQRLTIGMRSTAEKTSRRFIKLYDALIEAGYAALTDEELEDPKRMLEIQELVGGVMQEQLDDAHRATISMKRSGDRTLESFEGVLTEETMVKLKLLYYRKAYPLLGVFFWGLQLPEVDDAMAVTPPEQQDAVRELLRSAHDRRAAVMHEAIVVARKAESDAGPGGANRDAWESARFEVTMIHSRANGITNETMFALADLIGEEEAIELQEKAGRRVAASAVSAAAAAGVLDEEEDEDERYIWSGDEVVSPRITKLQVRRLGAALALDRDEETVLHELHESYVTAYDTAMIADAVAAAADALWETDDQTGESKPTGDAEIAALAAARAEATAQLRALDEAFLGDVEAVLVTKPRETALERFRVRRDRAVHVVPEARHYAGGWNRAAEATIDVATLVEECEAIDLVAPEVADVVAAHERDTLDLTRERYAALLEAQAANERWNAAWQRRQDDEAYPKWDDYLASSAKQMIALDTALAEKNAATVVRIRSMLSEIGDRGLLDDYNRHAHPSVYVDGTAVMRQLLRVWDLEDLDVTQRRQIEETAATYRSDYEDLSVRMIELGTHRRPWGAPSDSEQWREWRRSREELEKLMFQRNELNYRAINQLRTILEKDQVRRIGDLPTRTATP